MATKLAGWLAAPEENWLPADSHSFGVLAAAAVGAHRASRIVDAQRNNLEFAQKIANVCVGFNWNYETKRNWLAPGGQFPFPFRFIQLEN